MRLVVLVARSCKNASQRSLVSPGTRFEASETRMTLGGCAGWRDEAGSGRSPEVGGWCWSGCGFDGDAVAELFELADETFCPLLERAALVEVVGAEFVVGDEAGEDVVGGDEDRVATRRRVAQGQLPRRPPRPPARPPRPRQGDRSNPGS